MLCASGPAQRIGGCEIDAREPCAIDWPFESRAGAAHPARQRILPDRSLSASAAQNGGKRQNLRRALVGEWRGPKAAELVARVAHDLLSDAA
jgi:hypothetical protein